MKLPIYMDNHATTPLDPGVLEEILPCFTRDFGNPESTSHSLGRTAETLVEKARQRIASLISARAEEIIFTSGATESNNLVLKGIAEKRGHVITVVTEHKSVLDPCRFLERSGCEITYLRVGKDGLINLEDLKRAITGKTILISVMMANNEIGVIQPMEAIGKITQEKGILFHSDATQAVGRIPVNVNVLGVDFISFSAHKMYGPKGIGALWIRKKQPKIRLVPQMHGGGQEQGIRSGTLNVPAIVGFGKTAQIAEACLPKEMKRLEQLRSRLLRCFQSELDEVFVNGSLEQRLPGNLNLCFRHVEAEAILLALQDEIALSTGSACASARTEPSHVLKALGLAPEDALSSLRFGLGRFNTEEDVDMAVTRVSAVVKRLRAMREIPSIKKVRHQL